MPIVSVNNPLPLHTQIREILKQEISANLYTDKIPSERELMNRFSVSRSTIREAINHLVHEGILEKIHGKGTFITRRNIQDSLNTLHSLTDTIKRTGMTPGSKLLFTELINEPDKPGNILLARPYHLITRLRTANGMPIAVERHYYTKDIGDKLLEYDLNQAIIYDLLEQELGLDFYQAEQIISCKQVSNYDSNQLHIPQGINALFVERTSMNSFGQVLEYYTGTYKPDTYSFHIHTKRHNVSGYKIKEE